jgi:hypothetical protein
MFRVVVDLCIKALDRADYLITLARLSVADWVAGPFPETEVDRIGASEAERLHRAFLKADFDWPMRPLS